MFTFFCGCAYKIHRRVNRKLTCAICDLEIQPIVNESMCLSMFMSNKENGLTTVSIHRLPELLEHKLWTEIENYIIVASKHREDNAKGLLMLWNNAVFAGNDILFSLLLKHHGVGDDIKSSQCVPLEIAVTQGRRNMVRTLLEHGSKPNQFCRALLTHNSLDTQTTILAHACSFHHQPEIVKDLLEFGADPNLLLHSSDKRALPIFIACKLHAKEIVYELVKYKADVTFMFTCPFIDPLTHTNDAAKDIFNSVLLAPTLDWNHIDRSNLQHPIPILWNILRFMRDQPVPISLIETHCTRETLMFCNGTDKMTIHHALEMNQHALVEWMLTHCPEEDVVTMLKWQSNTIQNTLFSMAYTNNDVSMPLLKLIFDKTWACDRFDIAKWSHIITYCVNCERVYHPDRLSLLYSINFIPPLENHDKIWKKGLSSKHFGVGRLTTEVLRWTLERDLFQVESMNAIAISRWINSMSELDDQKMKFCEILLFHGVCPCEIQLSQASTLFFSRNLLLFLIDHGFTISSVLTGPHCPLVTVEVIRILEYLPNDVDYDDNNNNDDKQTLPVQTSQRRDPAFICDQLSFLFDRCQLSVNECGEHTNLSPLAFILCRFVQSPSVLRFRIAYCLIHVFSASLSTLDRCENTPFSSIFKQTVRSVGAWIEANPLPIDMKCCVKNKTETERNFALACKEIADSIRPASPVS